MKQIKFIRIAVIIIISLFFAKFTEGLQIYSNSANSIEIKLGEEFAIALDSKPDGGYRWQLAKPLDQRMLSIISSGNRPNGTNNKYVKGKEMLFFKGVGRGETMISLKYARRGEKDMYPLRSKIFIVHIK